MWSMEQCRIVIPGHSGQEIGSNCNVWREIAHSGLEGMWQLIDDWHILEELRAGRESSKWLPTYLSELRLMHQRSACVLLWCRRSAVTSHCNGDMLCLNSLLWKILKCVIRTRVQGRMWTCFGTRCPVHPWMRRMTFQGMFTFVKGILWL